VRDEASQARGCACLVGVGVRVGVRVRGRVEVGVESGSGSESGFRLGLGIGLGQGDAHAERLEHVALRALEERVVQLGGQVVGLQVERHALRTATPRAKRRVVGRRDAQPLK
jgi:hypothetical protein